MMNPVFDQFTQAVSDYVAVYPDKNLGHACLLGKLMAFMDFNLSEEQMTRLIVSLEKETIQKTVQ
ncbi:MAG: hypothetical protein EBU90_13550 [Proteobacteria bacterium]|nr:hypothetical protein [Pseudomonadota bacterium]